MITCLANVEDSIEIGCLTTGSQHGTYAPFECGYFGSHGIIGRVLQAGIEITAVFKIEKTRHLFTRFILESSTLIDWQHTRLALFGSPSCLYAEGFGLELFGHNCIGFI